jgi:hypothetical protein
VTPAQRADARAALRDCGHFHDGVDMEGSDIRMPRCPFCIATEALNSLDEMEMNLEAATGRLDAMLKEWGVSIDDPRPVIDDAFRAVGLQSERKEMDGGFPE